MTLENGGAPLQNYTNISVEPSPYATAGATEAP